MARSQWHVVRTDRAAWIVGLGIATLAALAAHAVVTFDAIALVSFSMSLTLGLAMFWWLGGMHLVPSSILFLAVGVLGGLMGLVYLAFGGHRPDSLTSSLRRSAHPFFLRQF